MSKSLANSILALLVITWLAVGCGSGNGDATAGVASPVPDATEPPSGQSATSQFVAEVWADNWFALYVNGQLVGKDSTPITTERSFNAETITFTAAYPLTIGIEAKDFKETDSGLEYIGERNQQMGRRRHHRADHRCRHREDCSGDERELDGDGDPSRAAESRVREGRGSEHRLPVREHGGPSRLGRCRL